MSSRRAWVPFAGLAVVLAIALLLSGLNGAPVRVFALGAANQGPVITLTPRSAPVCEGPIRVSDVVGRVRVWAAARGTADVQVSVLEPSLPGSGPVDVGHLSVGSIVDPYTVPLHRPLRPDGPLTICLSHASVTTALYGAPPADPAVTIRTGTKHKRDEFSLVLLGSGKPSFWNSLSTIADRASLFRFSWVGAWAIWLLGAALLAAVVACGVAISLAAREDDQPTGPDAPAV